MDEIKPVFEPEDTIEVVSMTSDISEQERIIDALEKEQYLDEKSPQNEVPRKQSISKKRERNEDDEEEWETVQNKEKKYKAEKEGGKYEIYISASEKMPKQFALARIFKSIGVMDIDKVKYVNPFKIRIDVQNETAVHLLENCTEITNRGWRVQRALEVTLAYGVIKDVDLDIEDHDILKSISCPEPGSIVSVMRLLRRKPGGDGWEPSESVRISFRGSFRPAFISVDGLRIKVDPYYFPVSQCSHCWSLGHTAKRCPSSKVVCPKCSKNHANCETTSFKCVNCGGNHMALLRSCPAYCKEKRLRELMAEFNCTYRRALTLYVPVTFTNRRVQSPILGQMSESSPTVTAVDSVTPRPGPSYAEVITQAIVHKKVTKKPAPRLHKQPNPETNTGPFAYEDPTRPSVTYQQVIKEDEKKEKDVKFSELTSRLQEIFFLKGVTIQDKVQQAIKCCLEWIILVAVENISDWPVLKPILAYLGM